MADKQYDLAPQQQKVVQEYAQRRALLREEYIKQITNPHRHGTGEGGTLFDSGVQRFMSMRVSQYEYFKPTPKSTAYGLGLVVVPILGLTFLLKYMRDKQEHLYRTGQVAYKDRRFKFI